MATPAVAISPNQLTWGENEKKGKNSVIATLFKNVKLCTSIRKKHFFYGSIMRKIGQFTRHTTIGIGSKRMGINKNIYVCNDRRREKKNDCQTIKNMISNGTLNRFHTCEILTIVGQHEQDKRVQTHKKK